MVNLSSFDYFRKVPKEFTEGTGSGPILSVIAAVVMGALFVLEFKDFMKVTSVTDLVMDPGGVDGNDMYIAFKVSMPDLVCQFASIEVVDGMGTERQGIHKDMDFKRIDEDGNIIGDYVWGEDKLVYEEIPEEKTDDDGVPIDDDGAPLPEKCTVTLFEHPDFTGWEAKFQPGEYDHAALLAGGAMNDDCESIAVSEGCFAVVAENGEHDGWELVLSSNGGDGKGRYDGASLDALGNHPEGKHSVLNGVSSMVVHEGTVEEAKEMAAKVKKGRAEGLPQRGQIDLLDEGSFDQYMADRPDKLIVVDFTATWCGPCQRIAPVFAKLAEEMPDVVFIKVDVDENEETAAACGIQAMPTFQFYIKGEKKEEFSGASEEKIREAIAKHKP